MKHLPLLLALIPLWGACSKPEPLLLGDIPLPYATVADAADNLQSAYPTFGIETLRSHLLQFGLAEAEILHASLAEQSAASQEKARNATSRLENGIPFEEVYAAWCAATNSPDEMDAPAKPHPSDLGAAVSAAVAVLEPGEWAGPIRSAYGWEVVLLVRRDEGVARNRAEVSIYRMQWAVGTASDRRQAGEKWAKVPLSGNQELIQALPLSLRQGRVQNPPSE